MLPIPTDDPIAWSVCTSVTLVHPAKAVARNEMPFGRDICVVPSNVLLDRDPSLLREGEIGGSIGYRSAPVKICIVNCGQTVTGSGIVTIGGL